MAAGSSSDSRESRGESSCASSESLGEMATRIFLIQEERKKLYEEMKRLDKTKSNQSKNNVICMPCA